MPADGSEPLERAQPQAAFAKAPRRDKAQFDAAFRAEIAALWTPEPSNSAASARPIESKADLLLYGGAAGGGKTDLMIGLALTGHTRSVIFRSTYVDLDGVEQRLIEILGSREGYNGADMALRRPGCLIEFGALERPGSEFKWQGRSHDFIAFDEGAQLPERAVRHVMAWLRSPDPNQRCRVVIASNPPIGGEGEWLLTWFAPWLDPTFPNPARPGELRWRCMRADGTIAWVDGPGVHTIDGVNLRALSCTFIPARLSDNRFLDARYEAQLMGLPEPLRSKLLHGDFLAGREDGANQVIPWEFIRLAQERWRPDGGRGVKMTTIGIDVAQGGADDTVLAPLHGTWFAPLIKRRGIDTTNGPAVVALVVEHMRDSAQIVIDLTGGWGGSAFDHLAAQGIRAEPVVFSRRLARTDPGRTAQLPQRALRDVVESAGGAEPAVRRGHRAAAGQAARRAARGADLAAARQRDRDREQAGHLQAARHLDRRRRCGDPRLAQARRGAAAADEAAAQSGKGDGAGVDGGVR